MGKQRRNGPAKLQGAGSKKPTKSCNECGGQLPYQHRMRECRFCGGVVGHGHECMNAHLARCNPRNGGSGV